MKKTLLTMLVALCVAITMQAQDARFHRGGRHNMDPMKGVEMRVNQLDKELTLTADQKAKITQILTEEAKAHQAKMGEMHKDGNKMKPTQDEMKAHREKMQAHHNEINAQIEALLTPDQKAKFAQLKDQGPRMHRGMRGGHGKMHGDKEGRGCCGVKEGKCCEEMKAQCGEIKAKECEEMKAQCGEMKAQCGEMKAQCGEMKAQCGEMKTQCGEMKAQCDEMKAKCSSHETKSCEKKCEAADKAK